MDIFYDKKDIREFERKILASGDCDSFIPMSFAEIDGGIRVTYHLQGYGKITDEHIKNPYQLLNILEMVVLKVKRAENHFILYGRYLMNMEDIYVNESGQDVKLLFIPVKEGNAVYEKLEESFKEKITLLLEQINSRAGELRGKEYIGMLLVKIQRLNLSKQGVINYIGELKREAYICGWE